jgi:hypothetical protein
MFGTLRSNAAYGFSDLPPAGTVTPGRFCCLLAQTIGRTAKQIGELEGGQGTRVIVNGLRGRFSISALHEPDDDGFEVCGHTASIPRIDTDFNYVLTTMC